jgi:hypothetical protein
MSFGRREFLTSIGVLALGAAASVGAWFAGSSRAPTRGGKADNQALLKMGLYSWDEMTYLPTQIRWLGLSYARIGGAMSDSVMTFCANNNIEVLYKLADTAAGVQPRTAFDSDEAWVEAYLALVDTVLTKYGPRGTFWTANPTLRYSPITQMEIHQEPEFGYMGMAAGSTNAQIAALYAKLLIAAYNHIKANWPAVTVVGFVTSLASHVGPAFTTLVLDACQAAGQLDCFDVMSIHAYSLNKAPEQTITEFWGTWVNEQDMAAIRQLMRPYGLDKPVWATENGYQISQADGGRYSITSVDGLGNPVTVTPTQQAAYTIRLNMAAARNGISRVYHMSVLDTDDCNFGWFGLGPSYDPRPVAIAMRQLMRLLRGATHLDIVLDGGIASPGSPYAYRFSTPHGRVMVAWCQTPATVTLPIEPGTQTLVTDMLGNAITTLTGSSYLASLSETPIFLYPSSVGVTDNNDGTATT